MFFVIYRITNTLNSRYYIGRHATENLEDSYYGSGKAIKNAIKKYGIEYFKREIIAYASSREELWRLEQQLVNKTVVEDPLSYNMAHGGKSYLDGLKINDYEKFIKHQSEAGKIGGKVSISKRDSAWHAKGGTASKKARVKNGTDKGYQMSERGKKNIRASRLNSFKFKCDRCDSIKVYDGGNFSKHLKIKHYLDHNDITAIKSKLLCARVEA